MDSPAAMRVVVVGGGITGLAAAHRLIEIATERQLAVRVSLLEASERIGGVFGTEVVDGYRLERGADMFITDKPWGLDLCRRLGLEERLIAPDPAYRKSLILSKGRPVPTPEAFNLMVPGKLWPILSTPLLSPLGKLRLMCEPFISRRAAAAGEDESLASFVRRRLGRETLDRIVQPLVGGIYTGDPEQLSLAATLPRFQVMEQQQGSLTRGIWRGAENKDTAGNPAADQSASGARYGLFVSLRDGMGELQEALWNRLQGRVECRRDTVVQRIERQGIANGTDGGDFRLVTTNSSMECDAVILALPAYRAGELIADWQPELSGALKGIEYASSAVVVSAHDAADIADPLNAYGLVIPAREQRRILAVSFLHRKFPTRAPAGKAILRTFVGGALQPELCELDDHELAAVVATELRSILGVRGEPELLRVVRYPRAMPQYHVGHLARIQSIEAQQRAIPGLFLCGNAYRGVGLPDCIHDGEVAAESALGSPSRVLGTPS
ncbi:MAG: protoporphyrinogen oxidase [Planctomycetaceae bacterium]